MYCWFRRNWNTWKASSKFHTTPLIRFLLRHAQGETSVRYIVLHAFVTDNTLNWTVWISRYIIQCPVHAAIGLAMCVSYSGLGHGALDYSEVRLYRHLSKHPLLTSWILSPIRTYYVRHRPFVAGRLVIAARFVTKTPEIHTYDVRHSFFLNEVGTAVIILDL
jgi:hypothetical protein